MPMTFLFKRESTIEIHSSETQNALKTQSFFLPHWQQNLT